jgi:dCTP diphosphatase
MEQLKARLRQFAAEREWGQFHSPKNLAIALSVEVAEILEHFQWLTDAESNQIAEDVRLKLKDEIGDVLIYLVRLADKLDIDPIEAALEKNEKNKLKYPVQLVRGKSKKYTEYQNE